LHISLVGDDAKSRDGDGVDVGDDEDGAVDGMEMPPYAKEESMVSISLRGL
jgi:hypothetical protein